MNKKFGLRSASNMIFAVLFFILSLSLSIIHTQIATAQTPDPVGTTPTQTPVFTPPPRSEEGPSTTPTAQRGAIEVTVKLVLSADGKTGAVGPINIELKSNGTAVKAVETDKKEIGSDSKKATPITLTAKFFDMEAGKFKACVQGTTICSAELNRTDPIKNSSITLTIPADKSDKYITAATGSGEKPTCGSLVAGTGWILCPLIKSVAGLNDLMWALVNSLLFINPLQPETTQGKPLYEAWGQIRNIANVVFVIFFLIIIYSQLTSTGVTNYGIKKLLPKLIICAILVNLSFIVIQIAVDLSNILGKGLYDILITIANKIPMNAGGNLWLDLFEAIVAAGGAALTGLVAAGVGGPGALLWLMAPSLLMAGLAMLAALITLSLRQAAIPILAILAPLAFVAYLLPNTERWYKKWRDLLITMMMMYPIASIIFAGSRIASALIWNMGGGNNFWWHMIALIVMAVPLFSLPFIARQGGAILTAANGMMNKWAENARKPFTEYSRGRAGLSAAEYRKRNPDENPSRNPISNLIRRQSRAMATRKRAREFNTSAATAEFNQEAESGQVTDWRGNRITEARNARVRDIAAKRMGAAQDKHLNAVTTRARQDVGEAEYRSENQEQRANYNNTARLMNDTQFDGTRAATEGAKTVADTASKLAEIQTEQNAGVLQVHVENAAVAKQHENTLQHTKRVTAELGTSVDHRELSADAQRAATANPGVRDDLRQTIIESAIETTATARAEKVQKQDVATAMVASGAELPGNIAYEAAGVTRATGGIATVQAGAQQIVVNAENEEVQARAIGIDSSGDPVTRVASAETAIADAIRDGDVIGARAAMTHLTTTGGGGRKAIVAAAALIPSGDTSDVTKAIKRDIGDVKDKNIALDKWKSDEHNRSYAEVLGDANTYSGLTSESLAQQSKDVVAAGIAAGGITPEMAARALDKNIDKMDPEVITQLQAIAPPTP